MVKKSPVREYRTILQDSGDPGYVNRILVATATTGSVRVEWVQARLGVVTPVNWSNVQTLEFLAGYMTKRYSVADAQNIILKNAIEKDFEWLLLWEHDVIPGPDAIIRLNDYILAEDTPVISGLYYTRSRPAEPLIFRGRGTTYYDKWKLGDKVWCDGIPTGFVLIHMGILREMWKESPEYIPNKTRGIVTRRVFETPRKLWYEQNYQQFNLLSGTSDLYWCTRVMEGEYFKKSGWTNYQRKKYPFLVDTNIFCRHINPDGEVFP